MNIVAGALAGTGPGAGWRIGADEAAANHCVAHTLRAEGFDASEDGTGRGTPLVPVGVDYTNLRFQGDICGTLEAAQNKGNRGHGVLVPFDTTQITSAANRSDPKAGDPCHPLAAGAHAPAIAFQERGRDGGRALEIGGDVAYAMTAPSGGGRAQERNVMQGAAVRRLMPIECERLQGFPDGYTAIPWRGKPSDQCPDGPRYKALGNSWAVNCARWIGRRIEIVESIRDD